MRIRWGLLLVLFTTAPVWSAKVIMKDGKIYEGKIIGETREGGDVLMRTTLDKRPRLLPGPEILSIVRDSVPEVPQDPQRYAALEIRLSGNVSASKNISLDPAAGLAFAGSLRIHPLIEVAAGLDWIPERGGELTVSDGTTVRGYESFYQWAGGFHGRLFPFYTRHWKVEPFLTAGYHWSRLVPKASGDSLRGQGLEGGAGVQWPWSKNLYVVTQLVFRRVSLDGIWFQGREGGLESPVFVGDFSFSAGLSYHWG